MSSRDVYTERKGMYFGGFRCGVCYGTFTVLGTGFRVTRDRRGNSDLLLLRDCP